MIIPIMELCDHLVDRVIKIVYIVVIEELMAQLGRFCRRYFVDCVLFVSRDCCRVCQKLLSLSGLV